jgi:hypothetical protein
LDPASRRRNRKRNEQNERSDPDENEGPFKDILENLVEIKEAVKRYIGHEMQERIEERKKPRHTPEFDQVIQPCDPSQG